MTLLLIASLFYGDKNKVEHVDFNSQVKPILSDKCFRCHGPNKESRKRHLRFDVPDGEEGAFRIRKGEAAIVPGDLAKSLLYYRITTDDEERAAFQFTGSGGFQ